MKSPPRCIATILTTLLLSCFMSAQATHVTAKSKPNVTSMLSALTVQDEVATGYLRSKFRHWIDVDKDSCNTRNEVLIAESTAATKIASKCSIKSGKWLSKYDNIQVTKAKDLDVDHFVPLNEAWQSGAYNWDDATRTAFANDLGYAGSLIAVSAKSNRSKGDKDPNRWMPNHKSYRCEYLANWVAVKYRWSLSVDASEKKFLVSEVKKCGAKAKVSVPKRVSVVVIATSPKESTPPTQTPVPVVPATPTPVASQSSDNDPRYSSCTAAKGAGYGPYRRGVDPEYEWYTDRDSDGIVCE